MADKIQRILLQYEVEIDQLKKDLRKVEGELEDTQKTATKEAGRMTAAFKKVGVAVAAAFSARLIGDTIRDLGRIAAEADGVRRAFQQAFSSRDLAALREATSGTVSDLELMKKALLAREFRIPREVLAKGLEFARVQANKLGKDVNFLSDSIVDGLGRKSALILDNLGISQVELSEAVKETGDFYTGVATIIDSKLGAEGSTGTIETLADRQARLNAQIDNLRVQLATQLAPAFEALLNRAVRFADVFATIVSDEDTKRQLERLRDQEKAINIFATQLEGAGISSANAADNVERLVKLTESFLRFELGDSALFGENTDAARQAVEEYSEALQNGFSSIEAYRASLQDTGQGLGDFGGEVKDGEVVLSDYTQRLRELQDILLDLAEGTVFGRVQELVEALNSGFVDITESDVADDIDTAAYVEWVEERKRLERDYTLFLEEENTARANLALEVGRAFLQGIALVLGNTAEAQRALLVFEKGLAIAQVIIELNRTLAQIKFNLAAVPAVIGALPNPAYLAAVANAAVQTTTAKIQAGTSIAAIAGAAIPQFAATFSEELAKGTSSTKGGLTLVGERGPEAVVMPKGAAVLTADATRNQLAAIDALNAGRFDQFVYDTYLKPGLGAATAAFAGGSAYDDHALRQAVRSNKVVGLDKKTRRFFQRIMTAERRWH